MTETKEEQDLQNLLSDDEYFAVIQQRYGKAGKQAETAKQAEAAQADEAWRAIAGQVTSAASPAIPLKPARSKVRPYLWPAIIAAACAGIWIVQRPAVDDGVGSQPVARNASLAQAVTVHLQWLTANESMTVTSENSGFAAFYAVTETSITAQYGLDVVAVSTQQQTLHLPATLAAGSRLCALTASTREGLDKLKTQAEVLVPQLTDGQCLPASP